MKIAVIGAGAMGCLYGATLSESGNEVWMLDSWERQIEEINKNGLIVEDKDGEKTYRGLRGTSDPQKIGAVDIALVFVKSTNTEDTVKNSKCLFADTTTVVTLQNGLGNIEKIAKTVAKENIIAGTTAHGSTLLGPGKIRHAGRGKTVIGELDGAETERLRQIADVFSNSGLEVETSRNIIGLIWDKLLINIGVNALTAITELNTGGLLEHAEIMEILTAAEKEAVTIANLKGISLSRKDPVERTMEICRATFGNKTSMLQDILNKRKTEIDMINGAIVTEGRLLGVDTPINMVLTNLVKWKQK